MDRIYSATYSNVPVFEFVTPEGLVMRRKQDLWINATHILKVAKFPKAKRTRILEKDVQTRTHAKVQGGYGKYQGTYVPLEFGEEIAKTFGIYDELKPIFDFQYIEGKLKTPPPAPKHSHALAQNAARKQAQLDAQLARKLKSMGSLSASSSTVGVGSAHNSSLNATASFSELHQQPRKRGRPRRKDTEGDENSNSSIPGTTGSGTNITKSSLASSSSTGALRLNDKRRQPAPNTSGRSGSNSALNHLTRAETTPILRGPSIGTFNNALRSNSSIKSEDQALRLMVTSLNVQSDDLEPGEKSSDDGMDTSVDDDDNELLTGNELFGSPRNLFEKMISRNSATSVQGSVNIGGNINTTGPVGEVAAGGNGGNLGFADPYGLSQYHTQNVDLAAATEKQINQESNSYFNTLLAYFLEEFRSSPINSQDNANTNGNSNTNNQRVSPVPEVILNPPHPLNKIGINQPVDNEGNSVLHWACAMGNLQIIEFLLTKFRQYLSVSVKNNAGETPLMFLTRFSNSYTQKNFGDLLDILFDLLLLVDNSSRTVLHHVVMSANRTDSPALNSDSEQALNYRKNKEKFARYYLDTLFNKIFERGRSEIMANFINHQDINGNTGFHIVAYNLNKKLIKGFISYHKYINFSLKNLVNYTVEEYLASHNFVLRIGSTKENNTVPQNEFDDFNNGSDFISEKTLGSSVAVLDSIKSSTNQIKDKLTELVSFVEKELVESQDNKVNYAKFFEFANLEKMTSQKEVLKFFRLDHLLDGIIENETGNVNDEYMAKSNQIIQEEIIRLVNDLTFELLKKKEYLFVSKLKYKRSIEYLNRREIKKIEEDNVNVNIKGKSPNKRGKDDLNSKKERIAIGIQIQDEIIKRRKLVDGMIEQQQYIPLKIEHQNVEEFKENAISTSFNENSNHKELDKPNGIVSQYSKEDKLWKYCKLISICCGMNFNDVERMIDLIEQSLAKGSNGGV